MDHSQKSAYVQNFQIGGEDYLDDGDFQDAKKGTPTDRRDMARMNKPQEMRVCPLLQSSCVHHLANLTCF